MISKSIRFVVIALVLSACTLAAADLYLTPDGAGKRDGSSWDNALAQASFNEAVNDRLKAGDRLMLGGGAYPNGSLKLATGGTPGKPKSIIGVDRGAGLPVFASSWTVDKPDKGPTCITLQPGASHFVVQHLRIRNYNVGVNAPKSAEAPRSHLTFDDVDVEQQRHGYYLSHCDDLVLENCDLKRYSKHGFRLEQGCNRVAFRKCTADCSEGDLDWETKTELFPFGFTVNDGGAPSTKVTFEDCVAKNNRKSNQGSLKYTNGDGFVVEGNTQDVTFTRCRSFRNQDGGFDLKVDGVRLTDCISTGNRRAFRIWRTGTLTNCFGGWSSAGLWCKEGGVTATRCTFHENQKAAVEPDDKATAPIVLADCLITISTKVDFPELVELRDTVIFTTAGVGEPGVGEPGDAKVDATWDGTGPAMDSVAFPNKGYNSAKK